jgi:hypothetical protein
MKLDSGEIERYLGLLAQTPARIEGASQGLEGARFLFKADDEDWSANDNLAHVRACADVWGGSILKMLTQEHPTLHYVSPRTYIRKTDYPSQEFRASLAAFTQQRGELLRLLTALPIESWSRGATFTGTVSGREATVFSYARRMVEHEIVHCEQIEAVLKSS